MGTGMKSLKWEGIGTKNPFPHTSTVTVHAGERDEAKIKRALFHIFYSCPNSITSICCGFVELLCLTQIHNNSETGPQQIECLCNKSATSERAESN